MATLNTTYTFTNGNVAEAGQVNTNFNDVESWVSTNVVQIDGSVQAPTIAIADGAITLDKIANALKPYLIPIGTISAFGSATPPTGWLLCDGQSTSGYAALAGVVGANVPDLRGRTIIGIGSGAGLTARTIKDTGGAETHVLTEAQLANHTHAQTPHEHAATPTTGLGGAYGVFGIGAVGGGAYSTFQVNYSQVNYVSAQQDLKPQPANANIQSTGSNQAHNNMQPFYALNYIIKH